MFVDRPRRPPPEGGEDVGAQDRATPSGPAFAGMTAGAFPGLLPGSAPLSPPDPLERLERLALLHERGALTDDEFLAQKTKLLDEI
ncbi:SHOCT domain-containing protein [Paraconexibacter sp.]|uniref:SHOCT domain-containing protein n=1 Tax=Paraconexibacter sp. TaxID=2949640 RepID=UPI00356B0D33